MTTEPNPEPFSDDNPSGRQLMALSLGSFFFYLVLSWVIVHFFHESALISVVESDYTPITQIVSGGLAGALAAGIIMFLAVREPLAGALDDFYLFRVITRFQLTPLDRLQVSFFAGVGEELLFRGAIQPLFGVWATSILFVGIHGYFRFRSPGQWLFGALMFGLSVLLGFLTLQIGLFAAMSAHAVYDVLMLWWVGKNGSGVRQQSE